MNITTRSVLRHFLRKLHLECSNPKVAHIDPFFQRFFTKKELKDIVYSLLDTETLGQLNPEEMTKEDLLEIIGDDSLILGYYLDRWDNETCSQVPITAEGVYETLTQLKLDTHYLWHKEISDWDSNDVSNYRALQLKAGKIAWVYGIYDASITPQEVDQVTSPPNRFYESHELAQTAMQEMIAERNIAPSELHILSLYADR